MQVRIFFLDFPSHNYFRPYTSLSIEQDINKYDLSTHTSQVLT